MSNLSHRPGQKADYAKPASSSPSAVREKMFAGSLIILLLAAPLRTLEIQKKNAPRKPPPASAGPAAFKFPGWEPSEKPRKSGKSEFAARDGETAIFLQYGFIDLTVHRYKPAPTTKANKGRTLALELYRMETPADAFGIFSIRRRSEDKASPEIRSMNSIGPGRAAFVKGNVYVDILAPGDGEAEVEKVAVAAARMINLPGNFGPAEMVWLPKANLIPGSEHYIMGDIAAMAESPLLGKDFWGFKEGTARACTGRYFAKESKLVIMNFKRPPGDLIPQVLSLFKEYMENVRTEGGYVQGEDSVGSFFIFAQESATAALVLGETSLETAKARVDKALENSAGRRSKS